MRFLSHQPPVDSSSMTRWRTRLSESGSGEILKVSLQTALKDIRPGKYTLLGRGAV
jgi:hypothetical protein